MAEGDLPARVKEWIGGRRVDDAARVSGISRATLYNLMGGAEPRMATLRKLKAAGVRIPRDIAA